MGGVTEPFQKVEMERSLNRKRALLADLPDLKISPPTASFLEVFISPVPN